MSASHEHHLGALVVVLEDERVSFSRQRAHVLVQRRPRGRIAGEREALLAMTAVAGVLRRHVSPGEIDEVLAVLPDRFRC